MTHIKRLLRFLFAPVMSFAFAIFILGLFHLEIILLKI
jgi:hypothetical protein